MSIRLDTPEDEWTWAHGARVWFALVGSIVAWLVHLVAVAALAPSGCGEQAARTSMHLATVACAAVALAALWIAIGLARTGDVGVPESPHWLVRRGERFLGQLGVVFGVVNLALILIEEIDVLVFAGHGCG